MIFTRERGDARDLAQDDALIAQAVADVVRRQVDVGIDLVSDGEMSKISYATYVAERFTGFAGDTPREAGQDLVDYPGLLRKLADRGATRQVPPARAVSGTSRCALRFPLRRISAISMRRVLRHRPPRPS